MAKLDKAIDLYLRGFNSQYIKQRTGISIQSLLKQQLSAGIRYTKDDIYAYQVAYIRRKYTIEAITQGYRQISKQHRDLDKARTHKHIHVLGCGFGDYPKVFRTLLGNDVYNKLRNDCWQHKQKQTIMGRYGVENVFQKEVADMFLTPEVVAKAREKRTQTMLDRYGVKEPNQYPEFVEKMQKTFEQTHQKRYGVSYPTERPEIAKLANDNRQATMLERYGAKNSVEIEHIRNKIFDARQKNKTLNTSRPEQLLGELLIDVFGADDVVHNRIIDSRYPYHVDYYIKSRDLFIELNADKGHGGHWFDETSKHDLQVVKAWQANKERLEMKHKKPSRYTNYIKTWTQTDVIKRNCAKENNLKYLVFWDASMKTKTKKQIPQLRDVYTWLADGCPDPKDWKKENTY